MNKYGFLRISCVTPQVQVGNPDWNVHQMEKVLQTTTLDSDIVLFPELGITGYTCADLFNQTTLLDATEKALDLLLGYSHSRLIIVGMPVRANNSLYNCAVILNAGDIIGVVPKQFLPNYKEFYESRWFQAATGDEPQYIRLAGDDMIPFGIDLLFELWDRSVRVGVEICEDLWMPIPPSSFQAIAGAEVLLNLSASNETVAKSVYRRDLVVGQSGRCIAAYAYCSAGPTESTTDLVFGGHNLIAENGTLLSESQKFIRENHSLTVDVDVQKLQYDRRVTTSFGDSSRFSQREYRFLSFQIPTDGRPMSGLKKDDKLRRQINGQPFVPKDKATLEARCAEIFGIQCAGLAKRVEQLPASAKLYIGVSGGLDSTLALMVMVKTFNMIGKPLKHICGLTMPGFGTTSGTKDQALELMELLDISQETIDIRALALDTFKAMQHDPFGMGIYHHSVELDKFDVVCLMDVLSHLSKEDREKGDLVFENVQARLRTFMLMSKGFVVGTGDLSELALGWCTYNGDHMSMYNVNCAVPKTLIKFLVQYVAATVEGEALSRVLHVISETTISPELLPVGKDGKIEQSTEAKLGPYELHDFFLANFIRNGFSPDKILYLARQAEFSLPYPDELIVNTLRTFYTRFFSQQFKRSCVPDGPKVGSVSLSPRGDWRMPSDADVEAWLLKIS